LFLAALALFGSASSAQTIRVDSTPGHVAKTFIQAEALGAGIDRINTATKWLKACGEIRSWPNFPVVRLW